MIIFLLQRGRGIYVKSTGIVRRIDELGRVVLPIELRRSLDIGEKDALEIYVSNDTIVLKKHQTSCIFCNGSKDIGFYKGKNICRLCMESLAGGVQTALKIG